MVGSSGSGKSLLAHAVLGILPYNSSMSGEIRYRGEILDQRRAEQLRGGEIVLVPQSTSLFGSPDEDRFPGAQRQTGQETEGEE